MRARNNGALPKVEDLNFVHVCHHYEFISYSLRNIFSAPTRPTIAKAILDQGEQGPYSLGFPAFRATRPGCRIPSHEINMGPRRLRFNKLREE